MVAETLVLRPAKGKIIRSLAFWIATASVGVLMIAKGEGIGGWLCASFCTFAAIFYAVQLMPGASYLLLTPKGFIVCSLFRAAPLIPWRNISDFRAKLIPPTMAKYVVFDQPEAFGYKRARRLNRALVGGEEMIPSTYGMTAAELAELMNAWRSRHVLNGE